MYYCVTHNIKCDFVVNGIPENVTNFRNRIRTGSDWLLSRQCKRSCGAYFVRGKILLLSLINYNDWSININYLSINYRSVKLSALHHFFFVCNTSTGWANAKARKYQNQEESCICTASELIIFKSSSIFIQLFVWNEWTIAADGVTVTTAGQVTSLHSCYSKLFEALIYNWQSCALDRSAELCDLDVIQSRTISFRQQCVFVGHIWLKC